MVQETDLKAPIERLKESVKSTDELLALANDLAKNEDVDSVRLKSAQRNVLLDSLRVKRFHKSYKLWDNERRDQFIEDEIRAYNKKYAQMTRLHTELNELEDKYEDTKKSVTLPQFKFSIQTLQEYDEGKLLEYVERDANGEYPSSVMLDDIFSLDPKSSHPPPDYHTFNRLVNLEFRLRTMSQIKYEVLRRMRSHLTSKNSQWARRDNDLNQFITRELREKIEEVKKIRASESQDLKDVDVNFELEEYDDQSDEGEEEEKENDEEEKDQEKQDEKEDVDGDDDGEEKKEQTSPKDMAATPGAEDDNEPDAENLLHGENAEDEEMEGDQDEPEDPTEEAADESAVDVAGPSDAEETEATDMLID